MGVGPTESFAEGDTLKFHLMLSPLAGLLVTESRIVAVILTVSLHETGVAGSAVSVQMNGSWFVYARPPGAAANHVRATTEPSRSNREPARLVNKRTPRTT